MKEIRCKVHLFTFERFKGVDAPEDCVKFIDSIDEQYQMVSLTDEQYGFLKKKTEEEILRENNPYASPDFEGLRDDFTDIFNNISTPLLEKMRRLFEEDRCLQIYIEEALERIGVSVRYVSDDGEDDVLALIPYEPIYVKDGLIYNHPFGQRHIVSFFSDEEPFCPFECMDLE